MTAAAHLLASSAEDYQKRWHLLRTMDAVEWLENQQQYESAVQASRLAFASYLASVKKIHEGIAS